MYWAAPKGPPWTCSWNRSSSSRESVRMERQSQDEPNAAVSAARDHKQRIVTHVSVRGVSVQPTLHRRQHESDLKDHSRKWRLWRHGERALRRERGGRAARS